MFPYAVTVVGVGCSYIGTGTTPATIVLLNDANQMAIQGGVPTCSASGTIATWNAVTATNSIASGAMIRFTVTNIPSPTTDTYTTCIKYNIN